MSPPDKPIIWNLHRLDRGDAVVGLDPHLSADDGVVSV